jgi:hypothetical protein
LICQEAVLLLLDTVIGIFLKEGTAFITGSLKETAASRKSAARRFYALYRSLEEVQEAYFVCVEKARDEDSIEKYDEKLRAFDSSIRELRQILKIYGNELYGNLAVYSDMSGPLDPASAIVRGMRWGAIDHSDFDTARDALAKFIRENFKISDLIE